MVPHPEIKVSLERQARIMKQSREQAHKRSSRKPSRTTEETDQTPATERREIRKDIARVWWPSA